MRQVLRVAWYRFRATFRDRAGGYLAIVLLVGFVGALALGSLAAARRTQSSFPAFLAATNPSDLSVIDAPQVIGQVDHLPGVEHGESIALLQAHPLKPDGTPVKTTAAASDVFSVGSIDGLYFEQDRAAVLEGRMADPKNPDEVMMTAFAARALGLHVGQVVPVGFYDTKQKLRVRDNVTLVGVIVLNDAVVQDDAERTLNYAIFTPALVASLHGCCYSDDIAFTGLRLSDGSQAVARVEAEYEQLLPRGASFYVRDTSVTEAKAERAIKPESIALGVFGLIAVLATLLIAGQVIGRELRRGGNDLDVMRALGATPRMTTADGLIGISGSIVVGALLACAFAVTVSPLAPIGVVRRVYPSRGIAFDWTVLGAGFGVLVVALDAVAITLALRGDPSRFAHRIRGAPRRSTAATFASAAGFPTPAVAGVRFALEPGRGRNAVPVRSAMLGTTLAIMVVVGTVTFGASLRTLISHPALYGWNWNYELETPEGGGSISQHAATTLLGADHDVSGWTGVYFDSLRVDGLTVPMIAGTPNAQVQPPLLSGHGLDAANQIVIGPTTLAQLHKHVGDTVEAGYATVKARTLLTIVGTATMPAVGPGLGLHTSMGTGVLATDRFIQPDVRTGANALFVQLRAGADPSAAKDKLDAIAAKLSTTGDVVSVLSVQRPAEIVNYRSMGDTPVLLGTALAAGAVSALALTLIASVRRRRRDLALLKTLGFTRRQLAAVVRWQSTIAVAVGVVVGTPLGVVAGRVLWDLFARDISAVPHPTTPAITIGLIAIGALVLANAVAAIPGHQASRTPTALLLHAE